MIIPIIRIRRTKPRLFPPLIFFLLLTHFHDKHPALILVLEIEESSKLQQKVSKQEILIDLGLAIRRKLIEETLVIFGNQKVIFIVVPFVIHEDSDLCQHLLIELLPRIKLLKQNEKAFKLVLVLNITVEELKILDHEL